MPSGALFSHFIPCGGWEAVYRFEGVLKNESEVTVDIVHGDAQGQNPWTAPPCTWTAGRLTRSSACLKALPLSAPAVGGIGNCPL
ncbi:Tn3 family transposase [Streptomyces sp. NPDC047718]|uniref:Tn3 family transposase n=1 Tax=Streptomyces sp. NPDC047718 TaxID=3155479 RepID=UPI0033DFDD9A